MTPAEQARQFEADGFAVIDSLVAPAAIGFFRDVGTRIRKEGSMSIGGGDLLLGHPELVLPIVGSPRILDVAERVMGPFVQLDSVSLINVASRCEAGISWHRDPFGGTPRGGEFQRPLAINLLIYLQDMDDEGGPLRVIPGSHCKHVPIGPTERHQPHQDEVQVKVRAGSAVLMHNNLIHSRSRNNGSRDRMHISIVYILSCMKSSIDLTAKEIQAMAGLFRDAGNRRLGRLLGQDDKALDRYNSGFLDVDHETWAKWIEDGRAAGKA